jgi:hypothetical protein
MKCFSALAGGLGAGAKRFRAFGGGLGAGAVLFSLLSAAAFAWKPDLVGGWLLREDGQARARRTCERAERLARLSPDYLDSCRAAGL